MPLENDHPYQIEVENDSIDCLRQIIQTTRQQFEHLEFEAILAPHLAQALKNAKQPDGSFALLGEDNPTVKSIKMINNALIELDEGFEQIIRPLLEVLFSEKGEEIFKLLQSRWYSKESPPQSTLFSKLSFSGLSTYLLGIKPEELILFAQILKHPKTRMPLLRTLPLQFSMYAPTLHSLFFQRGVQIKAGEVEQVFLNITQSIQAIYSLVNISSIQEIQKLAQQTKSIAVELKTTLISPPLDCPVASSGSELFMKRNAFFKHWKQFNRHHTSFVNWHSDRDPGGYLFLKDIVEMLAHASQMVGHFETLDWHQLNLITLSDSRLKSEFLNIFSRLEQFLDQACFKIEQIESHLGLKQDLIKNMISPIKQECQVLIKKFSSIEFQEAESNPCSDKTSDTTLSQLSDSSPSRLSDSSVSPSQSRRPLFVNVQDEKDDLPEEQKEIDRWVRVDVHNNLEKNIQLAKKEILSFFNTHMELEESPQSFEELSCFLRGRAHTSPFLLVKVLDICCACLESLEIAIPALNEKKPIKFLFFVLKDFFGHYQRLCRLLSHTQWAHEHAIELHQFLERLHLVYQKTLTQLNLEWLFNLIPLGTSRAPTSHFITIKNILKFSQDFFYSMQVPQNILTEVSEILPEFESLAERLNLIAQTDLKKEKRTGIQWLFFSTGLNQQHVDFKRLKSHILNDRSLHEQWDYIRGILGAHNDKEALSFQLGNLFEHLSQEVMKSLFEMEHLGKVAGLKTSSIALMQAPILKKYDHCRNLLLSLGVSVHSTQPWHQEKTKFLKKKRITDLKDSNYKVLLSLRGELQHLKEQNTKAGKWWVSLLKPISYWRTLHHDLKSITAAECQPLIQAISEKILEHNGLTQEHKKIQEIKYKIQKTKEKIKRFEKHNSNLKRIWIKIKISKQPISHSEEAFLIRLISGKNKKPDKNQFAHFLMREINAFKDKIKAESNACEKMREEQERLEKNYNKKKNQQYKNDSENLIVASPNTLNKLIQKARDGVERAIEFKIHERKTVEVQIKTMENLIDEEECAAQKMGAELIQFLQNLNVDTATIQKKLKNMTELDTKRNCRRRLDKSQLAKIFSEYRYEQKIESAQNSPRSTINTALIYIDILMEVELSKYEPRDPRHQRLKEKFLNQRSKPDFLKQLSNPQPPKRTILGQCLYFVYQVFCYFGADPSEPYSRLFSPSWFVKWLLKFEIIPFGFYEKWIHRERIDCLASQIILKLDTEEKNSEIDTPYQSRNVEQANCEFCFDLLPSFQRHTAKERERSRSNTCAEESKDIACLSRHSAGQELKI